METSECFMFGRICARLAVFGNMSESNSPSVLNFIICPFVNFVLIFFVSVRTFIRWKYDTKTFPVHDELETAECSFFIVCFLLLGNQ